MVLGLLRLRVQPFEVVLKLVGLFIGLVGLVEGLVGLTVGFISRGY